MKIVNLSQRIEARLMRNKYLALTSLKREIELMIRDPNWQFTTRAERRLSLESAVINSNAESVHKSHMLGIIEALHDHSAQWPRRLLDYILTITNPIEHRGGTDHAA